MTTIFYGMSGTFKYTTMTSGSEWKESFKVFSDIKPWWNYRLNLFPGSLKGNDGDFVIYRLLTLSLPGYLPKDKDIVIERGISDSILCMISDKGENLWEDGEDRVWSEAEIGRCIDEELKILRPYGDVKKVLFIMLDKKFIEEKILTEPNRKRYYPDVETYLKKQEEYVEFTKRYNEIDEEILITDAYEYLKRLQGVKSSLDQEN